MLKNVVRFDVTNRDALDAAPYDCICPRCHVAARRGHRERDGRVDRGGINGADVHDRTIPARNAGDKVRLNHTAYRCTKRIIDVDNAVVHVYLDKPNGVTGAPDQQRACIYGIRSASSSVVVEVD